MDTRDKVRAIFKYLKLKIKLKKTLSKIWFNKQCLCRGVIPKYAKIKIRNNSEVAKKVKAHSEKLWLRLEIKNLYAKVNKYNKDLLYKHLELYKIYSFMELEEILYGFGLRYMNGKLEKRNTKLEMKLRKLIEEKDKARLKWKKEGNYVQRLVNFSDVQFCKEENDLLAKGLKYAPQISLNREKALIECEIIADRVEGEENKKQLRYEVSNIIETIYKNSYKKKKGDEVLQKQVNKLKRKIKVNSLIVTKADKGNTTVIMRKEEYIKKADL